MSSPAKVRSLECTEKNATPGDQLKFDSTGMAAASRTPELVIALCGPIGSPLHEASLQISHALGEFGYQTAPIKLSDLIRINAQDVGIPIDNSSKFTEIKTLIHAGDTLRQRFGYDILAKLAIAKIRGDRQKEYGEFTDLPDPEDEAANKSMSAQRICHVIDSIKNDAELELLRLIYGDLLFAIGIFSPLEIRRKNLERPGSLTKDEIDSLIDTDSGEEFDHGQSVRTTFPRCDYFLRVDYSIVAPDESRAIAQIVDKMRRFFSLLFRTQVITPTAEETAMYSATSAGRNSACFSRQVGAAVTSITGELLAVGWNDVPQSGGGLYGKAPIGSFAVPEHSLTPYVEKDERCFARTGAKCSNDTEKRALAEKVIDSLVSGGLVTETNRINAVEKIVNDSRVKDLIEFSRAVHAEMHAILGASRLAGDKIVGGKIFVTTYPCHSCARHIVAAGISEVHYIEPYRKSLATRLHDDALTEEVNSRTMVRLLQFDGIAPRRFIDLFEAGNRKKAGVLQLSGKLQAVPSTHVSLRAIPRLEDVVVAEILSRNLQLPVLVSKEK
ncbi:MAG: CMP deaminase [Gammaproteobacteria bacterium]|nr:CMP deaminase [Gammaproteobacteria bacterium]MBU0787266.1 CMP deaminase [Gammaproteobacteria bacterium]MBU0816006.1 CMP deaminase [Gammaproteobacteria bacterium]MBU1787545.1 CMP deaminase [Gammaproteobacteria bacterium]